MVKVRTIYSCSSCGAQHSRWQGRCNECGKWNTLTEEVVVKKVGSARTGKVVGKLLDLSEIEGKRLRRISTGIGELDRVLGGGLVPGAVVLMTGEPGIGKSTLLTQLAINIPKTIYVCGEESPSQVKLRVERLRSLGKRKTEGSDPSVLLLAETDVDVVLATISREKPGLVVVDSIQTQTTSDLPGMSGSISQIRECTSRLINYAKKGDVPVMLVGHVTKDGEVAGPKVLEHMVDALLDLTGDRYHEFRLLRAVKNRFGATDEVGVFLMKSGGMEEVSNPSEVFLEEREDDASGSCVSVIMEGTRPVLIEVQALVVGSELPVPRRVAQGVDVRRVQILLGVLQKHAKLRLGTRDVFVKVTGGLTIREPAVDLAIVMAVASSYYGKPLQRSAVAVGEVGLLGEVRSVSWYEKRVKEALKLGYKTIYSRDKYRKIRDLVKLVRK